jgi:hypothetical protein
VWKYVAKQRERTAQESFFLRNRKSDKNKNVAKMFGKKTEKLMD